MDWTSTERSRRQRARARGEDVPFRPAGRPLAMNTNMVHRAPVRLLLDEASARIRCLLPDESLLYGVSQPGEIELWNVGVALADLDEAVSCWQRATRSNRSA